MAEGNGKISLYSKAKTPRYRTTEGIIMILKLEASISTLQKTLVGLALIYFMNDENFVSGGITNENPTLLANLYDENGINTASGIGHDITAILRRRRNKRFQTKRLLLRRQWTTTNGVH